MKLIRTEQIWLKPNKTISHLCHLSKNLYNQCNYLIKQTLEKGKWIRYGDLENILNGKGTNPSKNYKQLPSNTAQHILISLDKSWKSFFKVIREWKIHPDKFYSKPNPPRYKKKNGEHTLFFTNRQCKLRDNILKFPKKVGLQLKTRLPDNTNIREVRIIPKGVGYVCEIVYEKEVEVEKKDESRIVGIDFGSSNIIAMVNNIGLKPIVVKDDGTGIKSINQFYNKRKAEIQSIYDKQGIKDGDKMRRLRTKRDKKANDWVHKLTRWVVNWCIKYNIGTIVVGHNENWKHEVKLGRRNNQNFVLIPFDKIIQKLAYKVEEVGITLKEQEESYTSKCSFLDDEPVKHHNNYLGKRIRRGLFRTAKRILINADVNAGYNIIVKSEPEAFKADGVGGCVLHPILVRINNKYKGECY
ncbi:transposase [candidate division WOR-3 bacterium]|nr:transposase [candidate division WOR-3 bacterium]